MATETFQTVQTFSSFCLSDPSFAQGGYTLFLACPCVALVPTYLIPAATPSQILQAPSRFWSCRHFFLWVQFQLPPGFHEYYVLPHESAAGPSSAQSAVLT